jgi:very-short-patch-repair endonuclease
VLWRLIGHIDQKTATSDQRIGRIAERQHGVLTIAQLRTAGVTDDAVKGRVRAGRLYRVHRGVYAVGHGYLSREGHWMAAVLASSGVLSHRSAATLWRLLPPRSGPIDVSVAGTGGRDRRDGLHLHRSRTLGPSHTTKRVGIPVTTPARTITDLRNASARRHRNAVSPQELKRAIRQAGVLGLEIDKPGEADRTRSELEHLFLRLCKRHGLPTPEVNVRIDSLLVDFLWRDRWLIVETDGYKYHSGREAFEDDRTRDLRLKTLGYEVVRLSYRQVVDESPRVADLLAAILSRAESA